MQALVVPSHVNSGAIVQSDDCTHVIPGSSDIQMPPLHKGEPAGHAAFVAHVVGESNVQVFS